jgi:putative flippase GtrA
MEDRALTPATAAAVTFGELVRFSIIGTIGFVADSSAFKLVVFLFGLDLYSARVFSFLVAATVTWSLNRRFNFKQARAESPFRQWLRFLGANSLGGAANYITYAALVTFVPMVAASPVLGIAAGSIAGLAFNFVVNKFWVFRAA